MTESVFACFDVETTGLDYRIDRVIEIAVLRLSPDGNIEGEWSTLVNAGTNSLGRIDIHGIQPSWLETAPSFQEIAGDLAMALSGCVPVAHNAPFDQNFLELEWKRAGLGAMELLSLDTLEIARNHGLPGRLGSLAEALQVPSLNEHQALGDCQTLGKILSSFLKQGLDLPQIAPFSVPDLSPPASLKQTLRPV